jgi:peptide/nickel transport system substrate-binding protein
MQVQLLGPVEAMIDGRQIPLGATKQRALLALLALHANTTVPVERLVDGLWGDDPPASAAKNVQLYVSQLRRLLAGADAEIVTHGRGYELRLADDAVDSARFERLVEEAGRAETANGAAREALAMWRGAALADVADEPFAAVEIRRLAGLRLRASELSLDADLADGRYEEALAELERLIEEHPLRERLHAQRMLALYRSGRQAEALAAYRHAREQLVAQIGAEPGPELRRLHEAVLRQDSGLDRNGAGEAPRPLERSARRARAGPSSRLLVLAAGAALLAAIAVFAFTRLSGADRLTHIDPGAIGVIDAQNGRITAQHGAGRGAGALAAGGGSMWVANTHDGTVSAIDADDGRTVTIPVGGEPAGLAFAAGSLWVADVAGRGVVQVNPAVSRVVRRIEARNSPRAIAAGFGSIWVASEVDRTVTRIDPREGTETKLIRLGANPSALAAGAGFVWVVSEEAGVVFRIEPRSGAVTGRPIGAGNRPAAVAVGAGAVWVANRQDATVWRIDPATGAVTDSIPVGPEPSALAAGADAVWVANSGADIVARIDPEARRVSETVPVGNSPVAIAVAGDSVWTTAHASAASHRGGTLRVESDGVCCLDPGLFAWQLEWLAYDGLVGYRRAGGSTFGTLVGNLATDVPEPSPDGRTYVFTLRPGLRYSDGSPVRPADFRASLERLLSEHGEITSPYYDRIVGARACADAPAGCDLSRGIVTDARARTITIHLTDPDSELLHKLAMPFAYVVPAGRPFGRGAPPPGTGPYEIDRYVEDVEAKLVRNRFFRVWSRDARPDGLADEIVFRARHDAEAQVADVERGAADVLAVADQFGAELPPARLRALAAGSAGRLYTSPAPSLEFMFLNVRTPPFDDVRVRRAVNYAVDRRAVAELSGAPDLAQPTCQFIPPGLPGFSPSCRYTLDPDAAGSWTAPDLDTARRLIDSSGTRGMRVTVWGHAGKRPVVRYFATLLRRLGYRSTARVLPGYEEYKEAIAQLPEGAQIGVEGYTADFAGPSNFLSYFACAHGNFAYGPSRFCDRAIVARIGEASAARRPEADRLWEAIARRVADAAPAVPLVNRRTLTLVSARVGNYQDHLLWGPLLDQIWVR